MGAMNKEQLADLIKQQVNQLKDTLGTDLSAMVRESVEQLATAPDSPWNKMAHGGGGGNVQPEKPAREKGMGLARCLRATAAARMRGEGPEAAIKTLQQWGDGDLADKWSEARQKALTAGDAGAGGFLVPEEFSSELIELLYTQTVLRSMGARVIQAPTGTLNSPNVTAGANANYIGESTNIPKSQQATGNIKLSFKKLAVLTPISNDLLRFSNPSADRMVRDDMVNQMRIKEDSTFIRSLGTESSPKGLRGFIPAGNKINSNTTVTLASVTQDLRDVWLKLLNANTPMVTPGWIWSPRTYAYLVTVQNSDGFFTYRAELERGTFWGYPFRFTTQIPENLGSGSDSEVYLVDFSETIIGESMGMVVDTSQEAAYHDGNTVQSAFSRDETAVRALAEHDFAMRHETSGAMLETVQWGV
jgi:HK97 family phage major capsid protein